MIEDKTTQEQLKEQHDQKVIESMSIQNQKKKPDHLKDTLKITAKILRGTKRTLDKM